MRPFSHHRFTRVHHECPGAWVWVLKSCGCQGVRVYVYARVRVYVYARVRVYVYARVRVYVYARVRVCVCVCARVRVYVYARVRVYVYARVRVYVYARVRVYVYARVRVYVYARVRVYVCAHGPRMQTYYRHAVLQGTHTLCCAVPSSLLGVGGPWNPGTLGPWDPGTLGPFSRPGWVAGTAGGQMFGRPARRP